VPGDANLRTPAAWRSEDGLERNHRPFGMKGFPNAATGCYARPALVPQDPR
jgi:hypothetical protein